MDHRRHDMRNGPNNKRMRNRNNSGGGGNNHNNNNRRSQNPMTRVFESNGPDIKIRGTASHVAEKYVQLARDARTSGDPVAAENYYQHAEHYFRLIAAAQEQFRQSQPQPRGEGEMPASEESGEDEGENFSHFGAEPGFAPREQPAFTPRESNSYQGRDQQPREHQPREHHPRDHQPREHQGRDHQPREHRHQPQPPFQPQPQPPASNVEAPTGLPSFITGPQPSVNGAGAEAGETGGNRFPPRRRRRPNGPRPETVAPAPADATDDT